MKNKNYNLMNAVRCCFQYAPVAASVKLTAEIINGALTPLMVLVVASFIDSAVTFVNGGGKPAPLFIMVALMAAYYAYSQVNHVVIQIADKMLENKLRENVRPQLIKKHSRISFALLENPETLDLITRVCGKTESQLASILNSFISLLQLVIQIFGTLFLLVLHVWWMLPLFIASTIPIAFIAYKGGKSVYLKDAAITNLTRRHYYLSSVLAGRETAAERTLFGYADDINRKFSDVHLKRSNMNTKNIAMEHITIHACGLILNVFVLVGVFALLHPGISHGLYVSLIGALIALARIITGAVSNLMWQIAEYTAYMREYTQFFALPESDNNTTELISFSGLEIRNLRFRYTPESRYILDGVSLTIEKGKSYSLIGRNGAGKSTLTKILLGLYRDFEGQILINGKDISNYGTNDLRRIFSIVYQDFAKYYIALGENITLGNDNGNLESALRLAELKDTVAKLPENKYTPLGKIYEGGMDISGGEWQKVAVARALYADTAFMILDEPTASLSPMTESKLYKRFAEITKDKTSLLISHRLGSTKLSDVLFVLDNGVISETGTHDELMSANGVYADMFKKQRSWYNEN